MLEQTPAIRRVRRVELATFRTDDNVLLLIYVEISVGKREEKEGKRERENVFVMYKQFIILETCGHVERKQSVSDQSRSAYLIEVGKLEGSLV